MKKLLLFTMVGCFLVFISSAQLTNTSWTGNANLLQADGTLIKAPIEWHFAKDTVNVLFASGGEPEVFSYMTASGIITATKISGASPCEVGTITRLKFEIKDKKLFLSVFESKCEAFTKALDDKPYTKIE